MAGAVTCRVLLVEDDADTRHVMVRLLQRSGCEVRDAASVEAALACLDGWQPTHVVLDLMLPGAQGTGLLEVVRRRHLPIRVAVLTAAGDESRAVAIAIRLGTDAVFHKPVVFPAIEEWLRRT